MDRMWREILWRQFGAAIEMLEDALRACPDQLWGARLWGGDRADLSEFWYVGYHTLFWLDLYLSGPVEGFAPPPPFTLDELDPAGLVPERRYAADELLAYLDHGRRKCRAVIEALTDEKAAGCAKWDGARSATGAAARQHAARPGTCGTTESVSWAES